MNLKYELQSIISGAGKNPKRSIIEAAAHDLGKSQQPIGNAQAIEFSKDQEAKKLIGWIVFHAKYRVPFRGRYELLNLTVEINCSGEYVARETQPIRLN